MADGVSSVVRGGDDRIERHSPQRHGDHLSACACLCRARHGRQVRPHAQAGRERRRRGTDAPGNGSGVVDADCLWGRAGRCRGGRRRGGAGGIGRCRHNGRVQPRAGHPATARSLYHVSLFLAPVSCLGSTSAATILLGRSLRHSQPLPPINPVTCHSGAEECAV